MLSFDVEVLKEDDMRKVIKEIEKITNDFLDIMKEAKEKGLLVFSSFVKM